MVHEQMAKQILCEASVGPGGTEYLQPLHIGDFYPEPGIQALKFGHTVMGVELGGFVRVCHFNEKFLAEPFDQVVHGELDVEVVRKIVQFEIEAVCGLRQNSAGDPYYEPFERNGPREFMVKKLICGTVWEVVAEVPEVSAESGCQSTVQSKLPHGMVAADADRELYAIKSVASFRQNLVFRFSRT